MVSSWDVGKVRILYINKISPLTYAGSEVRVWEIARRLVTHGHEVHVVCGKNTPDLPDYQLIEGVHLHNVHVLPAPLFRARRLSFFLARYGFYLRSIPSIARQVLRSDVVVDCVTPVASAAGPVCQRFRKPCVVVVPETFGRRWFKLKGLVTALLGFAGERFLLAGSYDAYLTHSQHTYDDLVKYGKPPDRVWFQSRWAGVERPRLPRPTAAVRTREVVCVARLVKQKNVRSLLQAWALVKAHDATAHLRLVSDGPERSNLERLARSLGIASSVTFEGQVSEERKWELLERSAVFAFPSSQEGFGIVLLEAMLAGLPIVAYDLPVYRQFVTPNVHGFFSPPGDHHGMAACILKLLNDNSLSREIGERNREYASEFTWERATLEEERALLRVVSTRAGARSEVRN